MKKAILIVASLFLVLSYSTLKAQSPVTMDYYVGKWKVLIKATPQGDVTMVFTFEKKDNQLSGILTDTTGKEISPITKVEFDKEQVSASFNAAGYDLILTLGKKDEDHVTGSLLGMFDAEGVRVKL